MAHTREPTTLFHIQYLVWKVIDWVYPPRCASCGMSGERWCAACRAQVSPIDHQNACPHCNFPSVAMGVCPDCRENPPDFDALRSVSVYQGAIRSAIHSLKYKNDLPLAECLSQCLVDLFLTQSWQVDWVCAVPLSEKRQRERGYNQSELLAQTFAWALSIPYGRQILVRTRETRTQVGLSAQQRRENVRGAFKADTVRLSGKRVLVIDDVATTSATLSACANALKTAGAVAVYALTLARAVHLDQS